MTMDKTTRDLLAQLQIQSFTVSVMIADVLEGKADDMKELGRQISALDTYIEFRDIWELEKKNPLFRRAGADSALLREGGQGEPTSPGILPGISATRLA
jgi:hypothetical protein